MECEEKLFGCSSSGKCGKNRKGQTQRRRGSQATGTQAENPFLIKFSVHFAVFRFERRRQASFPRQFLSLICDERKTHVVFQRFQGVQRSNQRQSFHW